MLQPARAHEADAHLAESLRLLESGHALLEAAHTHATWAALCRARNDEAGAREHFEQARLQLDVSAIHSR